MAICCSDLITQGLELGCSSNSAGVRKIWLSDFCNIAGTTNTDPDDGTISAITMTSPGEFFQFESFKETAKFNSNLKVTDNGSTFFEQSISLTIPKMQASKRTKLAQLVGKDLGVIVLDQNGLYWMLGQVNGLRLSERTADSGAKREDYNGYVITIAGVEPEDKRELTNAVVLALGL